MAVPTGRGPSSLDMLEQTVNEVLVHTGKAIRAQAKQGRKIVGVVSAAKINESNNSFNAILDSIEADILRAKATLRRDLEHVRAQKNASAAAAMPKQESSAISGPPIHQAPPAPMDVDSEEPRDAPSNSASAKLKTEQLPDAIGGGAQATMAPFPNMDLDSPVLISSSTATDGSSVPVSNLNKPIPSQPSPASAAAAKSPVVKRESTSRSPQRTAKPAPTPSAAASGAGKFPTKKATSPVATKVPSPVASRSTASPAANKVPSPVVIKSAAASPAVIKGPTSQPPTPTPVGATAAASKAISLSSSSSSPSVSTSPVLTKKTASPAVRNAVPAKATPPPPAAPAPAPAPTSVPAPAPAQVSTTPATAAPATTAAPVPAMEISNDISMDDIFDLTGPSASDEPSNADLEFTDMQFSLVPSGPEEEAQHTEQSQQQRGPPPVPQSGPYLPPKPPAQSRPPASEPVSAQLDDSDFDVEKFAADAAQNLMMDTAFSSAPALAQQQQQRQQQPQQPAQQQPDETSTLVADNGDDMFKFIDDGIDALGEDPTTSFDEMYMGGTDSIDIDNFFDTA